MALIDQDSLMAIQPELVSGESVIWAGRPKSGIIFHREDLFLVPFSLLWGGFAIFWEMGVTGHWDFATPHGPPSIFGALWGIPFVVIGQYIIWGRFLYAAWKKKRTHYAVTNQRVLVVQNGWTRRMASAYIDTLPTLITELRSGNAGILRFAQPEPMWSGRRGWYAWDGMTIGNVPIFMDVEDVDSVYRLISDLREKATAGRPFHP